MAGCSSVTSKICLTVIGLIFWGAAAVLMFMGAFVFKTYKHFDELASANFTLIPAGIIILVGVFLFVLGCMGCIAAFKENKCLLAVFFSLLLIVLTAEVAAGVLGYIFKTEIKKAVENGMKDALDKYDNKSNTPQTDQVDYLQKEMKCCGVDSYMDWNTASFWIKNHTGHVPSSCCNMTAVHGNITRCDTSMTSKDIYQKGCVSSLESKFQKLLAYIAGVSIAFAVIQFLGMICSCVLMCRSQEVRYEMLGGPNSGLRV